MEIVGLLVVVGVFAGALSTVAGLGGGLLLLLSLALVWDPARALACNGPALLIGNLPAMRVSRAAGRIGWAFSIGALPGSVAGGFLVVAIQPAFVHATLLVITALSVLRCVLRIEWRLPTPGLAPAGAIIGTLTGASGGAGLLVSPLMLASGLQGTAYVATVAGCAVTMHMGRLVGYTAGGLFDRELCALAALATLAILVATARPTASLHAECCLSLLEHVVLSLCVPGASEQSSLGSLSVTFSTAARRARRSPQSRAGALPRPLPTSPPATDSSPLAGAVATTAFARAVDRRRCAADHAVRVRPAERELAAGGLPAPAAGELPISGREISGSLRRRRSLIPKRTPSSRAARSPALRSSVSAKTSARAARRRSRAAHAAASWRCSATLVPGAGSVDARGLVGHGAPTLTRRAAISQSRVSDQQRSASRPCPDRINTRAST
jgi:uncharacterized membrane protein YfcA